MKRKVKKRWVEALRSKKYKQGVGELHSCGKKRGRFCVLGVLCALAVKAGVIPEPVKVGIRYSYATRLASLPPEVSKWSGLSYGKGRNLAHKNDFGASFKELAKYIEEEL